MTSARRLASVGAFVALTAACQSMWEYPHREDYAALRAIESGATEADIRSALGEPDFAHPKGTRPEVYCLSGRACRVDRIVSSRLLVYIRGKPSAYYFLDASGRVEFVYVGGA